MATHVYKPTPGELEAIEFVAHNITINSNCMNVTDPKL